MSRKAKGPAFKLKSSNNPAFKMMGSYSPIKNDEKIKWEKERLVSTDIDRGVTTKKYETPGTSKGFTPTKTDPDAFIDWKKKNPSGTREQYNIEAEKWRKAQVKKHLKTRKTKESSIEPAPRIGPTPQPTGSSGPVKPKPTAKQRAIEIKLRREDDKRKRREEFYKKHGRYPKKVSKGKKKMYSGKNRLRINPKTGCNALGECIDAGGMSNLGM